MKKELVIKLLLLLWALTATGMLVLQKQKSPATSVAATAQTANDEVLFVRQFIKQYLSYTSASFRQSQTAAAFLLKDDLREQRLMEIARLDTKLSGQNIIQTGEVSRLSRKADMIQGVALLTTQDLSSSAGAEKLGVEFRIQLELVPTSFENPTGFLISNLVFSSFQKSTSPETVPFSIFLTKGRKTLLDFPCAVENLEIKKDLPIQTKITTLNISEIQILLQDSIKNTAVKAHCRDQSFEILLQESAEEQTLFSQIPTYLGQAKTKATRRKVPPPQPYQKTLEEELGFVIEE